MSEPTPARKLSLLDALGLGINGIVGSGIYLLVSPLAARAGAASVAGVLACGLLCALIALSFAELSSMNERSGGPYLYARAAFGPVIGFAVGWLGAATGFLGLAAVARGFAATLLQFVFAKRGAIPAGSEPGVALAIIFALGAINLRGVKSGGRASTFLSIAKLVPLIALALFGVAHVTPALLAQVFHAPAAAAPSQRARGFGGALAASAFLAIFMMSGFEYAVVPAAEVVNARRTLPIAVVSSLICAALLYAMLQLSALALIPGLSQVLPDGAKPLHPQPLIEAGQALFGTAGARIIGASALVSMLGFCAGVALVAPRYLWALGEDGYLPRALAVASARGTPARAIVASTALTMLLALLLGYTSLVDASNVVILSGYALTALAAAVLRLRAPDAPRAVRLPFGPLIPLAGFFAAVVLLVAARPRAAEWTFALELAVLGHLAWLATALARRWRGPRAIVPPPLDPAAPGTET